MLGEHFPQISVQKEEKEFLKEQSQTIGIRKRYQNLLEIVSEEISFAENQVLYERILSDIKDLRKWHNVSIEMMLDKKQEELNLEDSIAPEEIKIGMPDLSALEIKRSFIHSSLTNESINFNLDDILKKDKKGKKEKKKEKSSRVSQELPHDEQGIYQQVLEMKSTCQQMKREYLRVRQQNEKSSLHNKKSAKKEVSHFRKHKIDSCIFELDSVEEDLSFFLNLITQKGKELESMEQELKTKQLASEKLKNQYDELVKLQAELSQLQIKEIEKSNDLNKILEF